MSAGEAPAPVLSAVIPAYGEGAHLAGVLQRVREALASVGEPYELIVVDDGSTDDTWEVLRGLSAGFAELRAVRLSRNFGKEAALCAGLEMARGRAVVVLDGDLQHPPELIAEMFRTWKTGRADLVEGVKRHRGRESWIQRAGSWLFYGILNRLSGHDLAGASDFKLMDRRVVEAWLRMGERNLFFRGMIAWLGFRSVSVPFEVPERIGGTSAWSIVRLVRLALTALTAFSSAPMQVVTLLGGLFFLFAALLGAQTLYNKVTGIAVSGFTTVILLQLIIGGLLMLSLGIIGEYIARIYEEVKGRPRYVVQDRLGDPS